MSRIIIPDDVGRSEELRKQLQAMVLDPRTREFNELRRQGLDSETAASLSGLDALDARYQADAVLSSARYADPGPIIEAARSSAYEIPTALRHVGSAAGAAMGSMLGMGAVRFVVRNSGAFGVGAGAVGLGIAIMLAARLITPVLGKVAAGLAIGGMIATSSVVTATVIVKGRS